MAKFDEPLLEARHQRKDSLLSKGTLVMSSVPNCSASSLRMEKTLSGLLYKVFICLALFNSYSCRLMANITLFNSNITGWALLYILRNVSYDNDYKGNNLPRFPYEDGKVNEWFQQQASTEGHATGTINMLNLRKRPPKPNGEYPRLDEAVFPPSGEKVQGFTMLYHGTMHEHAQSILEGIKLRESTTDGDFSCGMGFYVTNEFERAVDYAFSKSSKAAVLIFKIPKTIFDKFQGRALDLVGEENKQTWKNVVRDIRKYLKRNEHCFIEGPEMKRERGGGKTLQQLPDTHQMCVLDEEMAEAFDRHLDSVVFYNTSRREI